MDRDQIVAFGFIGLFVLMFVMMVGGTVLEAYVETRCSEGGGPHIPGKWTDVEGRPFSQKRVCVKCGFAEFNPKAE